MLCALLLLSTLVRQTKCSFKIFRLTQVSTLFISIGPVVKFFLDIPVKVCVGHENIITGSLLSVIIGICFLGFDCSAASIFFCPPPLSPQFCPHTAPTSKILVPPMPPTAHDVNRLFTHCSKSWPFASQTDTCVEKP